MTYKPKSRRKAGGRAPAMWAVPTVLAYRLPMLWMMAFDPTAKRQREARRMVSEKSEAAVAGALAMQLEMVKQAQSLWLSALTGGVTPKKLTQAGTRIVEAGAAPANRTATANARRLRRRKGLS